VLQALARAHRNLDLLVAAPVRRGRRCRSTTGSRGASGYLRADRRSFEILDGAPPAQGTDGP
jgi:hypothetical protein